MSLRIDAKPFLDRQLHEEGPLLFWKNGPDETRDGMVWVISACENPLCSCRDAAIEIYNADDRLVCVEFDKDVVQQQSRPVEGRPPYPSRRSRIFVDVDSGHVDAPKKPEYDDALAQWAKKQLDAPVLALLQRRFAEAKKRGSEGLVLDFGPGQWKPGDMLPYAAVYPSAQRALAFGGQKFFADDEHCVEPGCDCGTVHVEFHVNDAPARRALPIGAVWIELDGAKPPELDPEASEQLGLLQSLYDEYLRSDPDLKELANRQLRMRALAPEIHRRAKARPPVRRVAPKARPNGPCPCGSGRKYKKCCLNNAP